MTGYATKAGITTGLEQSLDDYLTGANTNLTNTFTGRARPARRPDRAREQRLPDARARQRSGSRSTSSSQAAAARSSCSNPKTGAVVRDGLVADVQPEPHAAAERLQRRSRRSRERAATHTALQNNATAGPLSAGLDVQDRHRRRRRSTRAPSRRAPRFYDPGYCTEYGKQVYELEQPGSGRQRRPSATSRSRRVSSTRSTRSSATSGRRIGGAEDPRLREAVRLLLAAAARHAADEHALARAVSYKQRTGSGSRRIPTTQVDPGRLAFGQDRCSSRRSRWRSSPRRSPNHGSRAEAVPRPEDRRARRLDRQRRPTPQTLGRAIKPEDRGRAEPDDAARRPGRDGRGRRIPLEPRGRRQDGHRGARARQRLRRVVRLLRAGRAIRATSSRSSSRSSRTASAPRSRRRSPRPSSKNSCTADACLYPLGGTWR